MKDSNLTKQERIFLTWMKFLTVCFLGLAILFTFFANWTLDYISKIGSVIFNLRSNSNPQNNELFWVVIANSSLWVLAYTSFKASYRSFLHVNYTVIIIMAKLCSTIGFFYCFLMAEQKFLYLLATIADTLVLIITWVYYRSAISSRNRTLI
tara:strand:+ start:62 stop:517 length:456 start_codon:yes stop_codon:yes gene_type:complete